MHTLPAIMRMFRRCAASKNASADAACTVPYTAAVVVPWRRHSSRKSSAVERAIAASANFASSGKVCCVSQSRSVCPQVPITPSCA